MTQPPITSRQNERVKRAAKLRSRRQRDEQGRFLIDGAREISRAMAAGVEMVEVFVCEEYCTSAEAIEAVRLLRDSGADVASVTPAVYEKVCFGQREDGIVAVAAKWQRRLDQLDLPPRPLVAVLHGIEKPGNVGAILRSADGADVDAVMLTDPLSDLTNPNTIRASLGTVFGPGVCTATADEAAGWLRNMKLPIVATRPEATQLYTEVDYRNGAAVVLGSEAEGLGEAWQMADVLPVRLPMGGMADSLNVSATAAILFYEAQRQRGWPTLG